MSKANTAMGDIDAAASKQQVPGVYQPSAAKDVLAGKDIDEGHGGINQTVVVTDDAAKSTSSSTTSHDNSPFVFPWHGRF